MQLCKVRLESGSIRVGVVEPEHVRLLPMPEEPEGQSLSSVLHSGNPAQSVANLLARSDQKYPIGQLTFLAPVDQQEVWAAGVTYKRSQEARERESVGAARFYDLVYSAPRPELFFKATARRVVGPGGRVRIRRDSRWSVPEPELALVLSPRLELVGYTIGNDMSARDIEGENPLYLPQAKIYEHSCALGPVITVATDMPPLLEISITLTIERQGSTAFQGATSVARMARTFEDLRSWLGRDNAFPDGAILLTGTGIIPPDDFSLASGDTVHIDIAGIGRLTNIVEQEAP